MIIVTSYREIEQFPYPIIPYLGDRYRNIRKYFQPDIPLQQHSLKEVGAFVLIENSKELNDLSQFHLYGGLEDQYIEYVKRIPNTNPAFYESYIIVDTDSGIDLIFNESILNIHQKNFIGGLMIP